MLVLGYALIIVLGVVVPPLLILVLRRTTQRAYHRAYRSPLSEALLREPGHSLREQIEAARFGEGNAAAMFMLPFLLPVVFVLLWAVMESRGLELKDLIAGSVVFSVLLAFSARMYLREAKKSQPLRLGWQAEVAVGQELNLLMADGYRVYHDVQAGKFNIDHVVIGPNGVFAVETQCHSKLLTADGHKVFVRGDALYYPDGIDQLAQSQAQRQADWLALKLLKACGEPVAVTPALVLPGWFVERESPLKFPILSGKEIRKGLPKWQGHPLLHAQIATVAEQVERMSQVSTSMSQTTDKA